MAEASLAEPVAEEAAAAAKAAALEVAEIAGTAAPPAQEGEPEVVYGRHLLPSSAEVPLHRLLARGQQALEDGGGHPPGVGEAGGRAPPTLQQGAPPGGPHCDTQVISIVTH
jgi:hypothetical protein